MKGLLRCIFTADRCNRPREQVNPAIADTYERVREQTHSITHQATVTHDIVWRKERAIQLAEEALALTHGDHQ